MERLTPPARRVTFPLSTSCRYTRQSVAGRASYLPRALLHFAACSTFAEDRTVIKQCSECPTTFDAGRDRSARALTCSQECRRKRKAKKMNRWYMDNHQHCLDYATGYYKANCTTEEAREAARKRAKDWYEANPERARDQRVRWSQNNRAKINRLNRKKYHLRGGDSYRRHLPALLLKFNWCCGICGDPLPNKISKIHVHHVKPVFHGGTNDYNNLAPAHTKCNLRQGSKWDGTEPGEPPAQLELPL